MRLMGIDYGTKRIGIALSDEAKQFALPERVIPNSRHALEIIKILCDEKWVEKIVIGESKNYAGVDNPLMEQIRSFKAKLEQTTSLSIVLEPEFLTSAEAKRIQGENDMLDASAAALILQSYIDKLSSAQ